MIVQQSQVTVIGKRTVTSEVDFRTGEYDINYARWSHWSVLVHYACWHCLTLLALNQSLRHVAVPMHSRENPSCILKHK